MMFIHLSRVEYFIILLPIYALVWIPWWGLFSLGWSCHECLINSSFNVITVVQKGSIPIVLNFPLVQIPWCGIFSLDGCSTNVSVVSLTLDLSPPLRLSSSSMQMLLPSKISPSLEKVVLDSSPHSCSTNRDWEPSACWGFKMMEAKLFKGQFVTPEMSKGAFLCSSCPPNPLFLGSCTLVL